MDTTTAAGNPQLLAALFATVVVGVWVLALLLDESRLLSRKPRKGAVAQPAGPCRR